MKTCPKCGLDKPLRSFGFSPTRKIYQGYCKVCAKSYAKHDYIKKKDYYIKKGNDGGTQRKNQIRKYIWEYLKTHFCVECGQQNPFTLDFDHRYGEKEFNISAAISSHMSLSRVIVEVKKCEVMCANCHRIKTAKDFSWWSDMAL